MFSRVTISEIFRNWAASYAREQTWALFLPMGSWAHSLPSSCYLLSWTTLGMTCVNLDPLRNRHKNRVKNAMILLRKKPVRKGLRRQPEKSGRDVRLWGKCDPKWRKEERLGGPLLGAVQSTGAQHRWQGFLDSKVAKRGVPCLQKWVSFSISTTFIPWLGSCPWEASSDPNEKMDSKR